MCAVSLLAGIKHKQKRGKNFLKKMMMGCCLTYVRSVHYKSESQKDCFSQYNAFKMNDIPYFVQKLSVKKGRTSQGVRPGAKNIFFR